MSITDVVNSIPALTDIGIPIIAIIVIAWLAEKNSSKQQEATMLHNEQMDKTFKIIANFTENLSELVALIREGNEKTDNTSDKVDEVSRKMDEVNRKLENIKKKKLSMNYMNIMKQKIMKKSKKKETGQIASIYLLSPFS